MLPWSHALLLTTIAALGGALAVRWSQLDSDKPQRVEHVLWLLGPVLVALIGAAGVAWGLHLRPAGVAGLAGVYAHSLLPATLAVALVGAASAVCTRGRSLWACVGIVAAALLIAAVVRLDARVLHFVTDSNDAAVRGWFIDRLIPVWPWRDTLLHLSGLILSASVLSATLHKQWRMTGLLSALCGAVVMTAGGLSLGWADMVDPHDRSRLAQERLPVLEAPGPLARPTGDLTVDEPGTQLTSLALTPPLRILVALPGTETLPDELRWTGWREVAILADDDPTALHLFGAAGQVWLSIDGEAEAYGSLVDAPERLAALQLTGSVRIQPDTDWTLGDLAALCVAVGGDCALRSEPPQPAQL